MDRKAICIGIHELVGVVQRSIILNHSNSLGQPPPRAVGRKVISATVHEAYYELSIKVPKVFITNILYKCLKTVDEQCLDNICM